MSSNKKKDNNNNNSFLGNKTNHPEEINEKILNVCHICNKEKEKCFNCSKCKSNFCLICIEEILKNKEQIEEIKKKNDNNNWICLMCEKICPCEKCNLKDNKCLVCQNNSKNNVNIEDKIKELNLEKNDIEKLKSLEMEEIKAVLENFEKNNKIYVCEKCLLNNKNIKNLLDNKLNLLFNNNNNNNNNNIENNDLKEDENKNKEKNIFNILDNDIKLNKNDINNNDNKINNNNNILNKFNNPNFLLNQIVTPEINNINVTKNLSNNSIPKDFNFLPMFQTENIIQNQTTQLNNNLDNNNNNNNINNNNINNNNKEYLIFSNTNQFQEPNKKQNLRSSEKKFDLNIDLKRIIYLEDRRTTLMIKNIPNKFNRDLLLSIINQNFRTAYDLFILPTDSYRYKNFGYSFINFTCSYYIPYFYFLFHKKRWSSTNSQKVCEITYSKIQGKNNLLSHYAKNIIYKNEYAKNNDISEQKFIIPNEYFNIFNSAFPIYNIEKFETYFMTKMPFRY